MIFGVVGVMEIDMVGGRTGLRSIMEGILRDAVFDRANLEGKAIRRDEKMSKEELIQFEGLVIEILPDARDRVQLDAGYEVVAYTEAR